MQFGRNKRGDRIVEAFQDHQPMRKEGCAAVISYSVYMLCANV